MRISDALTRFLEPARVQYLGTRNADGIPSARFVATLRVEPGQEEVTVFIAPGHGSGLDADLDAVAPVALTVTDPATHESYQIKGVVKRYGPCSAADREYCAARAAGMVALLSPFGVPEASLRAMLAQPSAAVTFDVRELFSQTPGPGAGAPYVETTP